MKSNLISALLGTAFASGNELSPKFKYSWMVSLTDIGFYLQGGIELTSHVHRHNLEIDKASEKGETYNVLKHIFHSKYKKEAYVYDVAIWKLDTQSEPSTSIKLDNANESSSVLNEVEVPVYNIAKCNQVHPKLDVEYQFCVGYPEGGKDPYIGDSGGPIFIEEHSTTVLVGIILWGDGCGSEGFPGVYIRASAIADFIKENSS